MNKLFKDSDYFIPPKIPQDTKKYKSIKDGFIRLQGQFYE